MNIVRAYQNSLSDEFSHHPYDFLHLAKSLARKGRNQQRRTKHNGAVVRHAAFTRKQQETPCLYTINISRKASCCSIHSSSSDESAHDVACKSSIFAPYPSLEKALQSGRDRPCNLPAGAHRAL